MRAWSITHFLFLSFCSDLYGFWILDFLKPCLWILILNFQFTLIKLKWVWLDMFYSWSMIKNIPKKKIRLCAWGDMRLDGILSFGVVVWNDHVVCSLKEPLVFVKSSTWMWPLPDCGSLRCVCNYKKCYHNSVSITWKHLKYVFNFHNSSLKN